MRILFTLWNAKPIPLGRLFVYPVKFEDHFTGAAISKHKGKNMLKKLSIIMLIIALPAFSYAEIKIFNETHKYIMGDNDSKNDARRICFLEAKRKILDRAGVYIESSTEVKNYQLTKDEISAYSGALLKVGIENEEWKLVGENMAVFLSVKAEVDTDSINKKLAEIKKDDDLQDRIIKQQSQLDKLEQRIANLQRQLGTKDKDKANSLLDERKKVLKNIEEIQASSVFDFWRK